MPTPSLNLTRHQLDTVHIHPDSISRTLTKAALPAKMRIAALTTDSLTTKGLDIVKSNWARPISTPPFYAYPIISGVCFTYGGVKTNSKGQVVDTDGRAIPGLYAAGEAAGLYYQVYTGATSVLRGAVFGKIAGAHAALRCGAVPPSRSPGYVR